MGIYLFFNETFCCTLTFLAKPSKKHDLQGKRIVFTGTLTNASRKQAEARAKTFGCFVGAAVSKNIDLIIAGDEPGDKVDKAKKLGKFQKQILQICIKSKFK